jgi:hypothetical protein
MTPQQIYWLLGMTAYQIHWPLAMTTHQIHQLLDMTACQIWWPPRTTARQIERPFGIPVSELVAVRHGCAGDPCWASRTLYSLRLKTSQTATTTGETPSYVSE